jgi:hypothetical protein
MRGPLAIAARELSERRIFVPAALVAGLLPFAAPLFPGVRVGDAAEARDDLVPVIQSWWETDSGTPAAGGVSTRLFRRGRSLVVLDPANGRLTPLTGPGA